MTVHSGTNAGTYFPVFDGNGNIVAYVNASNGAVAAEFEFGPFGELLRATGPLARECVFLFSTKFYDSETGYYYYGYRYYDPSTGRWLSRDPLWERGFYLTQPSGVIRDDMAVDLNYYEFVGNAPMQYSDVLGGGILCDCSYYWVAGLGSGSQIEHHGWRGTV